MLIYPQDCCSDYKQLHQILPYQDNPHHGQSSFCPPQRHKQYFLVKLDHPHVQRFQAWLLAFPFLLLIVDKFASWHQLTVD